ncbi:MAG: hypothetical protein D3920_02205 [Candidatus Electrothrix sp. AW2]|nr:hypothetical protein [Candidatus Electrothrix gigas]MCI5195003.1 hypothetical protein [Candidatus Electrothrix gigas]
MDITLQKTDLSVKKIYRKDKLIQIFVQNRLSTKKQQRFMLMIKREDAVHRIYLGDKKCHLVTKFVRDNNKIRIVIKTNKETIT